MRAEEYLADVRFQGIRPFEERIWLSSPTMHGDEQKWVDKAIQTNWVSTVGENINEVERQTAALIGRKFCIGLSTGTAAIHMSTRLIGQELYGRPRTGHGTLEGRRVFCSDMTFDATVNPVAYEGGIPVFIDTDPATWNMDPAALEKAFEIYPEVKIVMLAHLYGTPGKIEEITKVAKAHGALIIEDAAESLGATYKGVQTGMFGDVSILSCNGNKIITGSAGGMFLTDKEEEAALVRKWSTQSREDAPWYQHEELGYNYRMSNIIAGVIRGQLPYIAEHIEKKKAVYNRYREKLADLPIQMNPVNTSVAEPNYWLSCLTIDPEAMCETKRTDRIATYVNEKGKSCPTEILEALAAFNAEGRPIWKPMHMQPIYADHAFVPVGEGMDVGADIFERGVCLPSDNKMTLEQQDIIIDIIHRCFES